MITVVASNPRPCECDPALAPEGVVDLDIDVQIDPPIGDVDRVTGGITVRPSRPGETGQWRPLSDERDVWIDSDALAVLRVVYECAPRGPRRRALLWSDIENSLIEAAERALVGYVSPLATERDS